MRSLFRGGVHPPEDKSRTADQPIKMMPLPETLYVHLSQHIGAPAEALVQKGDEVTVGQIIGRASGFISANVHAPVTGKVKAVGSWPHPVLGQATAVHIEKTSDDLLSTEENPRFMDHPREKLVDMVKEAGITGMGGASFPTHVKLSPPPQKNIDTLVINGAECEPMLTSDHRLMVERGDDIVKGIRLLKKILGVERCLVGVENNKPDAIKVLERPLKESGIELRVLSTRYPQGGEKQLIYAVLKREVPPPPGLPLDVGVVVQNVGTALSVYEAVAHAMPLIARVVTVTGELVEVPGNILAPLGTPFSCLVDFCGGMKAPPAKVIMGGPMMGLSQYSLDVPLVKGTSGIILLSEIAGLKDEFMSCIRCGRCLEVCPMNLMPNLLSRMVEMGRMENIDKYYPEDCMECGSCSYICPSKRPLVHFIKVAKAEQARKRALARAAAGKKENG